jgi:lysozyme
MTYIDWREGLRLQLLRHEGVKRSAYQDHLGYWTIGVGRLIDERKGGGLSMAEIEYLLDNDINRVIHDLETSLPGSLWFTLSGKQKQALANMAFQLGLGGLLKFKKMLAALERGDLEKAEEEALNSRWAEQTPNRAREVAAMLKEKGP